MSDIEKEDPLTKLNTQLNRSMVLMDSANDSIESFDRSNKSIKINTDVQPANVSNGRLSGLRKSILKKTNESERSTNKELEVENDRTDSDGTNAENKRFSKTLMNLARPQNLKDLIQVESLIKDTTNSTFTLDDISDNEDVWIMDVPRTIDPKDLRGQTMTFGERTKLKIGEEKYSAINHDSRGRITCVLSTGQVKPQYRTVNLRATGTIAIRRKLSNMRKVGAACMEEIGVPFPENLKTRHPLFGVTYDGKIVKEKRRRTSVGKSKKL